MDEVVDEVVEFDAVVASGLEGLVCVEVKVVGVSEVEELLVVVSSSMSSEGVELVVLSLTIEAQNAPLQIRYKRAAKIRQALIVAAGFN